MSSHGHHWHVPTVHVHAPHVDWHEVEHPLRASLFAGLAVLGFAAGWTLASRLPALPALNLSELLPPPNAVDMSKELPREWRWERKATTFDHMYRSGAARGGVQDMYAKPRSRY